MTTTRALAHLVIPTQAEPLSAELWEGPDPFLGQCQVCIRCYGQMDEELGRCYVTAVDEGDAVYAYDTISTMEISKVGVIDRITVYWPRVRKSRMFETNGDGALGFRGVTTTIGQKIHMSWFHPQRRIIGIDPPNLPRRR